MKKIKISINFLYFGLLFSIILLLIGIYQFTKEVNSFFEKNYFQFNQVISVVFDKPVEIKPREPQIKEIIVEAATPEEINTPIKEYACKKWGDFHCLTMIAVFQAESGWDNDKWNHNTNDTLDWGIGMINSVNWKIPGCSIQEITDPYKNIDCSYKIWDRADGKEGNGNGSFNPWVAWKNNNYLVHYEK